MDKLFLVILNNTLVAGWMIFAVILLLAILGVSVWHPKSMAE